MTGSLGIVLLVLAESLNKLGAEYCGTGMMAALILV